MTAAEYKTTRERIGTQAEVAARLGVARSTVADRERGAMVITTEAALALSALGKRKAPNATSSLAPSGGSGARGVECSDGLGGGETL